ncbi:uncharacterized protein LOC141790174 [Halichoeres trimaculatus]|uniref:uncharacterized protein LOC141790174 n=1 Tax=Halichoeres trimaculatus TaxID=147232 RepID=UPI003D9E66F3
MVSRFLLLTALSCCVCGLELNMGRSSYQAEEKQSLTLDWTFTPKPHPSLKGLHVFCGMIKKKKVSVLFDLQDGVEIPLREGELSGRFQFDKDLLREGRIRLQVSSLRTEDSGRYWCRVKTDSGSSVDGCVLRVTAARNQTPSTTGPARNQTPSTTGPARNQTPSTTGPARNQTPSTTGPARNQTPSTTEPARNQTPSTTGPARNQTPCSTEAEKPDSGGPGRMSLSWQQKLIIALNLLFVLNFLVILVLTLKYFALMMETETLISLIAQKRTKTNTAAG